MKNNDTVNQHVDSGQDLCAALFQFRDALVELSLRLKDWQFDHDPQGRQATEQAMRELLEKVKPH